MVRASVDGFHNDLETRYRRGRDSPEGFWLDSYDNARFINELLVPFAAGPGASFRRAIHDIDTDQAIEAPLEMVEPESILIVDGIFMHRDELVDNWEFSVFLDADFDISVGRMAQRDGSSPDPEAKQNRRYVQGQQSTLQHAIPGPGRGW